MAQYSQVKFPPLMMERALKYYTKIVKACRDGDSQDTGRIGRKAFAKIFASFSIQIDDAFVRMMDAFDGEGGIDHAAFIAAMTERLFPPRPAEALSLIIPPSKFVEEKGRGRAKDFPMLQVDWNNAYHQSIDASDASEGKPVLHGIMSGRFYARQPPRPPSGKVVSTQMLDPHLNQALSKSLMEGAYYHHNPHDKGRGARTARQCTNFIQRNKSLALKSARPVTASLALSQNLSGPPLHGGGARRPESARESLRASTARDDATAKDRGQAKPAPCTISGAATARSVNRVDAAAINAAIAFARERVAAERSTTPRSNGPQHLTTATPRPTLKRHALTSAARLDPTAKKPEPPPPAKLSVILASQKAPTSRPMSARQSPSIQIAGKKVYPPPAPLSNHEILINPAAPTHTPVIKDDRVPPGVWVEQPAAVTASA